MKRFVPLCLLLAASLDPALLAAQTGGHPPLDTIVVKHFTNTNGMNLSRDFSKYFSDYICIALEKDKLAGEVVDQDTPTPNIVPANSVQIEGKFLSHENAGLIKPGKLMVEISVYRISDRALVRTLTQETKFPPRGDEKDRIYAYYTGTGAGEAIWDALRSVDLASISPGAPGAISAPQSPAATATASQAPASEPTTASGSAPMSPSSVAAPAPAPAASPAGADDVASVQLFSNPTGADITIDGNYVGNTPTLIKLKPGTHSIKMTMPGYAPWERSIQTAAGESRNFAATLEKTSP
ncbi:MAG TPA: PEGA domain-containing protein [Terracidiphilus sp.]|nr:PEGA domain-containing protein [Terracidiphilus sp.]